MMMHKMKLLLPWLLFTLPGLAQNYQLPLWPQGVPNQRPSEEKESAEQQDILRIAGVQVPDISVYLPAKRNASGQAVVICPGGGYGILAYDWEGTDIAKWLNSQGIAGIVLKYRLPSEKSQMVPHQAPLQDAQQAMRLVRKNASLWNIDPHKIGVMGFSAGGHLASTLGTHFQDAPGGPAGELSDISARPDFMILAYPVISMDTAITHGGSRKNLLGEDPDPELISYYSNELQVTSQTPPTFILHASDDRAVPIANSFRFYNALMAHEVASEMHVYPYGGHGFSLALGQGRLARWPQLLLEWLQSLN